MVKGVRRVRIFSALEVANICGVVNQTAINWIRNGYLKAFTTPGGQYRIYAKDLATFLEQRGMGASGEALQVMMENADWNTFLIAMEQSANNKIKTQTTGILKDYNIVQAYDWFDIGRKATEEKPGFIFLDTDLSGVDLMRILKVLKEDLFFGRPYVLLLSDTVSNSSTESKLADAVFSRPLDLSKLEVTIKNLERQLEITAA